MTQAERTDDELAGMQRDLRELTDLEAIYRLRLRYYAAVNEGRFDALAELFTPDARIDFGNQLGICENRGSLIEKLAGVQPDWFVKLLPHGHVADVVDDHATGYLFVEGRLIVGGESFITMGEVTDRYVRAVDGWHITQSKTEYYYAVPLNVGWAVPDNLRPFASL